MKINIFKKKNNFKKRSSTPSANFYWKIAVLSTFIIILASFGFDYYVFVQRNKEVALPAAKDNGQIPTVNKNRIANVLNYFSEREQTSNQILITPAPVVDPSL
ncbi:MAG: hypothetical protein P4L63_02445 [Candidatus Pacebacteria bacterium]|nr:hypothetical protein [Candidatus Paceibacterota bacterium]